jgi:hypothetical protein
MENDYYGERVEEIIRQIAQKPGKEFDAATRFAGHIWWLGVEWAVEETVKLCQRQADYWTQMGERTTLTARYHGQAKGAEAIAQILQAMMMPVETDDAGKTQTMRQEGNGQGETQGRRDPDLYKVDRPKAP